MRKLPERRERTTRLRQPSKGRALNGFSLLQRTEDVRQIEDNMDPVEIAKQILRVHARMASDRLPLKTMDRETREAIQELFDAEGALEALRNGNDPAEILKFVHQLNAIVPNLPNTKSILEGDGPIARLHRRRLGIPNRK